MPNEPFNPWIHMAGDHLRTVLIAGNPLDVLATNFDQPPSVFEKFPTKDVFIAPENGTK